MLATENFAIFKILQAIEKLSRSQGGEKAADGAAEKPDAAAQPAPTNANAPADGAGFAQTLIERHERSVNRIRSGK